MWKNHLKIAWRNLWKNKSTALINITGIAVGFACVLLIGLHVQHEWSFDRYHEKSDRLVRLAAAVEESSFTGGGIAKVAFPWGEAARQELPEVEAVCRFMGFGETLIRLEAESFYEQQGLFADSTVFELFSWPLLQGDPKRALAEPNSVVLTETLARRCFGDQNALNQTLQLGDGAPYRVTGILADVPDNSHFTFSFLASLSGYSHPDLLDWVRWNQFYTYLLLRPGADRSAIVQKFDAVLDKHLEPEAAAATTPLVQPLSSIHLRSDLHRELAVNGNVSYIYIFSFIALFILLIAGLNFINLATARALSRAKEVGVRKVVGASRPALVRQFLTEAVMVCFFGALLAVLLALLALPGLNELLDKQLRLDWLHNGWLTGGLLLAVVLTGLLSGIYPAFVLSSLRPESILKSERQGLGGARLRQGLVVFQFVIAVFLIVAALVVSRQVDFMQNKSLGFQKDQLIVLPIPTPEVAERAETFKDAFAQVPGVVSVAASANRPGGSDYGIPYQAVGLNEDQQPAMRCLVVDFDFLETYGMEIAQGRGFSENFATDSTAYLINEEAARQLSWDNPLEHQLAMPAIDRPAGPIVGVVKDFHFRSMHEKIAPLYIFIQPAWYSEFSIKLEAENINQTLAALEARWSTLVPGYPFNYSFFDEQFGALHRLEVNTAQVIRIFCGLSILITCLGLFGLSTFTAARRRKEVSIRKVLGASTAGIFGLLSKDFLILVLIALLIASPLAWYAMNRWLADFAYRVDLPWWVFLAAGVAVMVITLLTVSFQSVRAALTNPVKSLRSE